MTAPARPYAEMRAVLVGGSSGIGFETARLLLGRGVPALRIVGRDAGRGEAACARLREEAGGADVGFLAADCAVPEQAEAMAATAREEMDGVDLLVTSAGGSHLPEILFRISVAEVREMVVDDLLPNLLACRAVLPDLRAAGGGAIVTVASDAGKIATPGEAVVGANMAAIMQYTRGLAIEGKRDGIRANCVTPSLVEGTPLTERLMAEGTFSSRLFAKARPLAGLGPTTARDVAELIVFLAGPEAARITGQAVSVNGGISAA